MPKVTQLVLERAASRTQISWLQCRSVTEPSQHGLRAAEASQIKASSIVQQGNICLFSTQFFRFSESLEALYIPAASRLGKGSRNACPCAVSYQFSCPWGPRIMPLPYGILPLFHSKLYQEAGIYRKCTISYCTRKQVCKQLAHAADLRWKFI